MFDNAFEQWKKQHVASGQCSSNYEGLSTEMERAATKDMFSK